MPTTDRKLRVFLCHASQDKPIVRELYQRLLAEGWIDPWLDTEKLLPGQDWILEIEKAVEASDAVFVFLSNNSVSKEGIIQRELRYVLDIALTKPEETIFVIPLRLDDCEPPRRLRALQFVDYYPKKNIEKAYSRLLSSLIARSSDIGIKIEFPDNTQTQKGDLQYQKVKLAKSPERKTSESPVKMGEKLLSTSKTIDLQIGFILNEVSIRSKSSEDLKKAILRAYSYILSEFVDILKLDNAHHPTLDIHILENYKLRVVAHYGASDSIVVSQLAYPIIRGLGSDYQEPVAVISITSEKKNAFNAESVITVLDYFSPKIEILLSCWDIVTAEAG